jgi:hypothetical protein
VKRAFFLLFLLSVTAEADAVLKVVTCTTLDSLIEERFEIAEGLCTFSAHYRGSHPFSKKIPMIPESVCRMTIYEDASIRGLHCVSMDL